MSDKTEKTDAEWRAQLTPEQYEVTRGKGTERPFTGAYNDCKDQGSHGCQPWHDACRGDLQKMRGTPGACL